MFDTRFLDKILGRKVEEFVHLAVERRAAHVDMACQIVNHQFAIVHVFFQELMQRIDKLLVFAQPSCYQNLRHLRIRVLCPVFFLF